MQPDYKIFEMNKRLQQRTDDSDNLWFAFPLFLIIVFDINKIIIFSNNIIIIIIIINMRGSLRLQVGRVCK